MRVRLSRRVFTASSLPLFARAWGQQLATSLHLCNISYTDRILINPLARDHPRFLRVGHIPEWVSSDGRFVGGPKHDLSQPGLFITDLTINSVKRIFRGRFSGRYCLTDDLTRIALWERSSQGRVLVIKNLGGRVEHAKLQAPSEEASQSNALSWSSDAQKLCFDHSGRIFLNHNGQHEEIVRGNWGSISPNGRWLVYQPKASTLALRELSGRNEIPLGEVGRDVWARWSPDSSRFLTVERVPSQTIPRLVVRQTDGLTLSAQAIASHGGSREYAWLYLPSQLSSP